MELIFAGRRRKLLALKALRDGQRHGTPHGAEQSVCPHCSGACTGRELADALYVCPRCGYHYPVGAYYRLSTILDSGSFRELNEKLGATDPLCFPGYREKLAETQRRTGLTEAVVTASGAIGGQKVIAAVLDSRFLMGSMVAVLGLDRDALAQVCAEVSALGTAELCNYNCPGQVVIGGESAAVSRAAELARERGARRCLPLKVSGPFHTSLLQSAGDALREYFQSVSFEPPVIPVLFNCLGREMGPGDTIPGLLERQVYSSVYLEDCIRRMNQPVRN